MALPLHSALPRALDIESSPVGKYRIYVYMFKRRKRVDISKVVMWNDSGITEYDR